MIDPNYVREMARYNSWQNHQLVEALKDVDEAVLRADRGAFFGSILATLNHVLWGDTIWMSRFDPSIAPPDKGRPHTDYTPDFASWRAARVQMDAGISAWAGALRNDGLDGTLTWHSGMTGRDLTKPLAVCVMQLFNHQTHHRGQVHAMLTAAGLKAPVSDLAFMPEDF